MLPTVKKESSQSYCNIRVIYFKRILFIPYEVLFFEKKIFPTLFLILTTAIDNFY